MITLKLASYTKDEVNMLAELLDGLQKQLHPNCKTHLTCRNCPTRHLCIDLAQATMYAEDYKTDKQ